MRMVFEYINSIGRIFWWCAHWFLLFSHFPNRGFHARGRESSGEVCLSCHSLFTDNQNREKQLSKGWIMAGWE